MSDIEICEECLRPYDSISYGCRVKKHKALDVVERIVGGIVQDIRGRRGIGNELEEIDEDILEEMYEKWRDIIRQELPVWVKTAERMPPEHKQVLVYRPNVLQDDPHDRPIRFSCFNPNYHREFECSHQPTEWLDNFPLPESWSEEHEERHNRSDLPR